MEKKGKDIMKKDRIDRLCKARDMAYLFCFLCIVSMIMFPINQVLGIRLPGEIHSDLAPCHNHFTVSGSAPGSCRSGKGALAGA